MNKDRVFCRIRKKYLILTPEEEIRQSLISYLIDNKQYPISSFSVEGQIRVNNLIKRYDILIYNKDLTPFMLIECKAANVDINQSTLDQLSTYAQALNPDYFLMTNGHKTYCFKKDNNHKTYILEESIPEYK